MKIGDVLYLVDESSQIPFVFTGYVEGKIRAKSFIEGTEELYDEGFLLTEGEAKQKNEAYCKKLGCVYGKWEYMRERYDSVPVYEEDDGERCGIVSMPVVSHYTSETHEYLTRKCKRCKEREKSKVLLTSMLHNKKQVYESSGKYFVIKNETFRKEDNCKFYPITLLKIFAEEVTE